VHSGAAALFYFLSPDGTLSTDRAYQKTEYPEKDVAQEHVLFYLLVDELLNCERVTKKHTGWDLAALQPESLPLNTW
jgi:hypothetical protein